jgi:hypothetical protein
VNAVCCRLCAPSCPRVLVAIDSFFSGLLERVEVVGTETGLTQDAAQRPRGNFMVFRVQSLFEYPRQWLSRTSHDFRFVLAR